MKEEQERSAADKAEMETLIAAAREAIGKGKSLDQFKKESLWTKPTEESEKDRNEKATNAYRDAEIQMRTE